ncbi:PDR/VanB family oxidoreductase [Zhihengliuella halotolerans]|uniref:PDR/VanB family oxidoreductase n=1 Tax=Zhihengliuella halotolerans TaxID=370736 RepID=UPI000C805D3A|nr:PDR/VanB family oxidoreductase [Zhihengliuella halotolerans]
MAVSSQDVWQDAVVVEARTIAHRIRRIVVEPDQPVPAAPGSHLDVRLDIDGDSARRSYSVVESIDGGRRLAISVLQTRHSRGGSDAMHALEAGQRLRITQPLQNFPLRIGAPAYVLVAGGIGITAIAHMAAVLKSVKADYRLHYVGRSREAMAYVDELEADHGDRLEVHADDVSGRFDVETLVRGAPADAELYMCGPIRLMDAVRRSWARTDREPSSLRYETFGNSGWFDAEPFTVRIPRLGVEAAVPSGCSLLEALEDAGVEMLSDCRKGECGICQVKVLGLEGEIDHRDVFFSERQHDAGEKLCACVSRAISGAGAKESVLTINVG